MVNNVISGGGGRPQVIHVKAAYGAGDKLNGGSDGQYILAEQRPFIIDIYESLCALAVKFKRLNKGGYGTQRAKAPTIQTRSQGVATSAAKRLLTGQNGEIYMCPDYDDTVTYYFSSNDSVQSSYLYTAERVKDDYTGVADIAFMQYLIDGVKNGTLSYVAFKPIGYRGYNAKNRLRPIASSAVLTARNKNYTIQTVNTALENGITPTVYQIQWALLNSGEYKEPDDAKLSCYQAGYDWLKYDYEETEETT